MLGLPLCSCLEFRQQFRGEEVPAVRWLGRANGIKEQGIIRLPLPLESQDGAGGNRGVIQPSDLLLQAITSGNPPQQDQPPL